MELKKVDIQHQVLNIFTIISCLLEEKSQELRKCHEIKELLRTAACYVEHEGILLGENPPLFLQEVSVSELMETIIEVHAQDEKEWQCSFINADENFTATLDRHYIGVAISYLLERLAEESSHIHMTLDSQHAQLQIHHNSPQDMNLSMSLNWSRNNHEGHSVSFWVALKLLKTMKISCTSQKGSIILEFPKSS